MINSIQAKSTAGWVVQTLQSTEEASSALIRQMASGVRIQSAADDSAGAAMAVQLNSRAIGLRMASRNTLDAISALQIADQGMSEVSGLLIRMRELAVQSANGTLTPGDRAGLQEEFHHLRSQLSSMVAQTKWNGTNLLDGTFAGDIQIGADPAAVQRISISAVDASILAPIGGNLEISGTGTLRTTPLYTQAYTTLLEIDTRSFGSGGTITATIRLGNGNSASSYDLYKNVVTYGGAQNRPINSLANAYDVPPGSTTTLTYNFAASTSDRYLLGIEGNWFSSPTATNTFSYSVSVSGANQSVNVSSMASAAASMSAIDTAMGSVNAARSSVGAQINSLVSRSDLIDAEYVASRQSLSTTVDLDYAAASAELARQMILRDAASSVLTQAHNSQRMALTLLQNL